MFFRAFLGQNIEFVEAKYSMLDFTSSSLSGFGQSQEQKFPILLKTIFKGLFWYYYSDPDSLIKNQRDQIVFLTLPQGWVQYFPHHVLGI